MSRCLSREEYTFFFSRWPIKLRHDEHSLMLWERIHEKGTSGSWEHFQGFAFLKSHRHRSLSSARRTNHPQEWLGETLESDSHPWWWDLTLPSSPRLNLSILPWAKETSSWKQTGTFPIELLKSFFYFTLVYACQEQWKQWCFFPRLSENELDKCGGGRS